MKIVVTFFILFVSSQFVVGQNWRDTLMAAKRAYDNQQFDEALRLYEVVKKIAPEEINVDHNMGSASYRNNDFEKAETHFDKQVKASKQNETIDNYHNLGNSRLKQEKYDEAIEAYKQALRKDPGNEQTRYNLAYAKQKKQQQDQQDNQQNDPQGGDGEQPPQPQQPNDDQEGDGDQENEENKGNGEEQPQQEQGFTEKEADRILDELEQAEKGTHKKLDQSKDKDKPQVAKKKKDW